MTRFLVFVLMTGITALGMQIPSSLPSEDPQLVTFNKDVQPILQENCQTCHRPDGIAPMSFLTYESTRPWAKAIKAAVLNKQMPPWFADPQYGHFRNAPQLTAANVEALVAWADSGAREGEATAKSTPRQWTSGWRTQPDIAVSIPKPYRVAAKGKGEIKEFIVPNPFKKDTWVSSIEILPGDPSVVHHVLLQIPDPRNNAVITRANAVDFVKGNIEAIVPNVGRADSLRGPQGSGGSYSSDSMVKLREKLTGRGAFTTMDAIYAPGSPPLDFRFTDSAKLIRAGSDLRIEVHYTPNGKETTDQTMVGFTLAEGPVDRRFVIMAPEHLVDTRADIPAGEANWETQGEIIFDEDVELVWFMPHMHLRGKDMTFRLFYPNGREETVLSARFNFHWQLGYEVETPLRVPRGTRMIVTAHHDNSANNAANPAPGKAAKWGEMTSEEMMLPWFGVVVDSDLTPDRIAHYRPGDLDEKDIPVRPAFNETLPFEAVAPILRR